MNYDVSSNNFVIICHFSCGEENSGDYISFPFDELDNDNIDVYDDGSGRYCGYKHPRIIRSRVNTLHMLFKSDEKGDDMGFILAVVRRILVII